MEFKTINNRLSKLEAQVAKLADHTSPGGLISATIAKEGREAFIGRAKIQKDLDELRRYVESQICNIRSCAGESSEIEELKKYCEETSKLYVDKKEKLIMDVSHIKNTIITANKRADELNERINNLVLHCTINTVAVILVAVVIAILR